MWQRSYEVETKEVSKDQVWEAWSDINRWAEWDTGIEYARTKEAFQKGCRFELKPKGGPKVNLEIVECQPGSHYIDLTRFPLAKMYGHHEMKELPSGALKLRTTMTLTGPLSFLWRVLVAQKIVDDLPADTTKLIEVAKSR